MFDVLYYVRPNGRCPFREFRDSLVKAGQKRSAEKLDTYARRLGHLGAARMKAQGWADQFDDIWELRPLPYRVFFFFDHTRQVYVVLNGFRKQGQKTPEIEKRQADNLMREYYAKGGQ